MENIKEIIERARVLLYESPNNFGKALESLIKEFSNENTEELRSLIENERKSHLVALQRVFLQENPPTIEKNGVLMNLIIVPKEGEYIVGYYPIEENLIEKKVVENSILIALSKIKK